MRHAILTGLFCSGLLAVASGIAAEPQGAETDRRPVTGVPLAPGTQGLTSSASDRSGLHLALYQGGFAAVHEQRSLALLSGRNDVLLTGLPDRLRLDSLSLGLPEGVSAGPVRLQPGIGDGAALRQRFVGERVDVAPATPDADAPTRTGRLLSVDGDRATVTLGTHIEQVGPGTPWRLLLPAQDLAPFGAATRLFAEDGGSQRLTLDYLTDGLGWSADHTVTLTADGARLSSHATLSNDTDATFEGPSVDLVAGEVHDNGGGPRPMAMIESRSAGPAAEPAGDHYRYSLPPIERLPAGQRLRVALDRAAAVATTRSLRVTGNGGGQRSGTQSVPARIHLRVDDRADRPLPAGPVRVYDRRGDNPAYLGSDAIGHTPPGEGFELTLGTAFNVLAERTQTDYRRLGDRRYQVTWEIALRNAGASPETVILEERLPGEWQLTEGADGWTRTDAGTLRREVRLEPGASRTISYSARISQ